MVVQKKLFLIFACIVALFLFIQPVCSASWWDSNWEYRKPVTVTDTSGSDLADFQVLFGFDSQSLVSAGKMNADCSDLRFADESDLRELSYWVESGCNTANTMVWVKVPSIPASSFTVIYMYYGNAPASSASNYINTFDVLGDGSDGTLTVSSAGTVVNDYDYLTGNEDAGETSIVVNSGSGFSDGDEILIIQMQSYSGGVAGTYEFRKISSGGGTTTFTLDAPLKNSYASGTFNPSAATVTQVVRVPQYTGVTVDAGASIISSAWNGYKGGVVIFRASGDVTVNGNIDVSGKGFSGGAGAAATSPALGGITYNGRGGSGGYVYSYAGLAGQGGGGGGGSWTNGGMGSGAAGTVGGAGGGGGGQREGCYMSPYGGGGGGGGYGSAGNGGYGSNNGSEGINSMGGSGATPAAVGCNSIGSPGGGGGGGIYGTPNLAKLYLGSGGAGGGGGWQQDGGGSSSGGSGAGGGGIIYVTANAIAINDGAAVSADGDQGSAGGTSGNGNSGGGGGGAGGSVYLTGNSLAVGTVQVTSDGGAGGAGGNGPMAGGIGGDGRIRLSSYSISGSTGPTAYTAGFDEEYVRKYASSEPASDMGVEEQSDLPCVTGVSFDPVFPESGQLVTVTAAADDPQGIGTIDSYSFTVKSPEGSVFAGPVSQGSNVYSFIPNVAGSWTVEITATDAEANTSSVFSESVSVRGWWDSNWEYRKAITVADTSGSDLADFQVLVGFDSQSLVSAGKMNADCSDLRFADESGLSGLGYWVESGCNTADTRVWVKVPEIPAGSGKTIYVYYGNAEAESASDGDAVFEFFDDFEDDVVGQMATGWVDASTGSGWSQVSDAQAKQGSKSLEAYGVSSSNDGIPRRYNIDSVVDYAFSFWARFGNVDAGGDVAFSFSDTNGGGLGSASEIFSASSMMIYAETGSTFFTPVDDTWYFFEFKKANSLSSAYVYDANRDLITSVVDQPAPSTYGFDKIYIISGNGGQDCFFDVFRIRKYASSEPESNVGVEEQSDLPYITGVSFDPVFPEAGQLVTVTATAADPQGIGTIDSYFFTVKNPEGSVFASSGSQESNVYSFAPDVAGLWTVEVTVTDAQANTSSVFSEQISVGGWWDSNWMYRKPITVADTSGSDLTDFQVLLEFDSASLIADGLMNADCSDLRFADGFGLSALGYWVESGCNTASTKVWVKVPAIPANGSTDIHMYYGNAPAESASSGSGTFEFFDDFEEGVLDKWKQTTYGSISTTAHSGTYSGVSTTACCKGEPNLGFISNDFSAIHNCVVEYWFRETARQPYFGLYMDSGNSNNRFKNRVDCEPHSAMTTEFWVTENGSSLGGSGNVSDFSRNTWYHSKIIVNGTNIKWYFDTADATTLRGEMTHANIANLNFTNFAFVARGGNTYADDIRVRKYASSDPAVSFGAQEQFGAPVVTGMSFNFSLFEVRDSVEATAVASDPEGDPVIQYDFRVFDGSGNEVLNPAAQDSGTYSFNAIGEPGLWQVKAKASDGEYWGPEFTKEVFVNDSGLATVGLSLSNGEYSSTELVDGSVVLSGTQSSGTFITPAIEPVNFSKWGVVTFSKTTPGNSALMVDVLDASDDLVLIADVKNGQNISGLEAGAIKLRANFTSGSTPTLDAWDVSYYSQFKITITDCSNPYSGEVTTEAVRVSDSEEFGPFTG
ncbi:MAG: DUF2341 domain-containing protein, partial [Candidatus Diapherotrites archaeon]|nr:DUF2341 domain-containing protein [Candidatus Diapherotrites archaeon]